MKRTKSIPGSIKFKAVLELIKGEKTLVELSREYGVHPNTLLKWKQTLLEKGAELFEPPNKEQEYQKRIRDLEQLLGKKEVEIALLKNFLGQGELDQLPLQERIRLAQGALARRLAPLPILLKTLRIPRATWYYQKKREEAEKRRALADEALKAEIEAILREHPEYGYRRLEAELRRRGMVVNGKRVRRLLHTFELSLTRKVRKPKPNPLLETLVLAKERANLVAGLLSERKPDAFEVLYTDFTQLVYGGGKVWFLPILDHRTRMVIGYAISFSPDVRTALQAWERAKAFILTQKRERPKAIVHHDQGGAFLSHAWVGHLLLEEGQRLSYSLRGPKENPIVESFFSRFKAEHQDLLLEARSIEALDALLAERIRNYNEHRLHSSLRNKTPQETLKEALSTSKVYIT